MKREYHQRTTHGQQNAEREPRNNYYDYTPTVVPTGGAGGYAPSYFAPAAYSAATAAASGRMPRDMQYHLPQPRSLHGFTPHPYGLDSVRSSAVRQLPDQDEEERLSDSSDESETDDSKSVWRDRKTGCRKARVPLMDEKEAKNLPPSLYSEVAPMSTHLPPMHLGNLRSKAEKAVKLAYERLLIEKRGVTVWRVIQAMLMQLNWDSLEALGLSVHDVPSLQKLAILEGKINTYIHCHVAVRRITTIHELSQEISQNEGVKDFDDLKLGPISFHPLVCQYFAFPAGMQVCKINVEDVVSHLSDYMNKHLGNVQVDDFLAFMSKARSFPSPQLLGVRLQSFGMYISFIRREKKVEKAFASQRASLVAAKETALKHEISGPSITSRIDAFLASAASEETHHTLLSSDNEDLTKAATKTLVDKKRTVLVSSHLQPNSCPYPSAAEERVRVCTKPNSDVAVESQKTAYDLSKQELGDFVAAWRGFIQKSSVSDVLMQMLANERNSKKKKKLAKFFKQYPAIGILNIAVVSMKAGHWNSMYDAFEEAVSADANETNGINAVEAVDRMEILSREPHPSMLGQGSKDVMTDYVCPTVDVLNEALLMLENVFEESSNNPEEFGVILKRLMKCKKILLEQLVPKSLNSNFRDSSNFVELYLNKVSSILVKFQPKKFESNLDVILPENRVKNFLYQLAMATENFEGFPENLILQLLVDQFHLANCQCWLDVVKRHLQPFPNMKGSSSLFYSRALLMAKTEWLSTGSCDVNHESREGVGTKSMARVGLLGNLTSVDARNCLLKAPMLCNILEWSQWNAVFKPTLGPLLDWLERENSAGDFVCLVTCQGSVLRIDGSATVEKLLAVAVRGLGKETAWQLVSLVAMYGGVNRVPRALLKSYLSKAIEVLVDMKNVADKKRKNPSVLHENVHSTKRVKHQLSGDARWHESVNNLSVDTPFDKFSQAIQFVLELFMHLPLEFVAYVSALVVPALCDIVPNAPVAMLSFCSRHEHRMRLHEVGLSSGITEWVRDFQMLFVESPCSVEKAITEVPSPNRCKNGKKELDPMRHKVGPLSDVSKKAPSTEESADCDVAVAWSVGNLGQESVLEESSTVAPDNKEWIQGKQEHEANEVISLIRKEEFGMDLELTGKELNLLAKQHARMGRALQCLSCELYSQDSHFVLELVQNADDNQYGDDEAAMLVFMLQQERVVVVNNELGFTPANMKALCDVGKSTKTDSAAGYIGQKGIGFKSVFRITDSPEIHSRGFHVKFDVSEGNIGFILPTIIPPFSDWHEIEEVLSLLESLTNYGNQTWNTCMVLPLKHTFVNGPDIEILSTKLGDVHPSLLLFLRRLCCITIKDDIRGTMRVMQRYDLEDGLVRVSDNESVSHWLVVKQQLDAGVNRPGCKTTEIALAFPLQEVSPGEFEALKEYQQVFSFLPLRSYGLRFIVQGDFVLPSSREDLDKDSPWNQWLLSEIPSVYVRALEAFKRLACSKQVAGKAASMFLSFLPHEGEVQGFFSSLPRMIFASLRICSCLPVEGGNREWALPCILLGGWNESVRKLLPQKLLWELLGLRYLHRAVHLSPVLATELGIRLYGSQVLIDFLESLCSKKDALEKLGVKWVSMWLVAFHGCRFNELQSRSQSTESEVAEHEFKRLRVLPFIPLSNGTYTSVDDGPLWLPSIGTASATGRTGLLRQFPLLYSELRMVDALLLFPGCIDNSDLELLEEDTLDVGSEERIQLYSVLRRLGIGEISEHKVITLHVLPSMTSENIQNKSDLLLMQCLAFVMVHLQSDCNHCKTEGPHIIDDLKKKAIIVTSKGRKRVDEEPLHFSVDFGCPVDVRKIVQGLQLSWTEVDAAYLQTFQGWSEEVACIKWRSFFMELGVTDFVKLKLVEKALHDKAASIWRDVSWEGFDDGGELVTIRDWESPEAVQILENVCNPSFAFPDRLFQCNQVLSLFDVMWDESYCDCVATYWRHSSAETISKGTTLSSFVLWLRSFPWIQSSFDGKLYRPKDLFHKCSAVESLLGNNAPYAEPQLKSTKLAIALGLHTVVALPTVLHVFKLWNQAPIHMSVEQMTKLYTWLWNEGKDGDMEQFLQSDAAIFVPEVAPEKPNKPVLGRFVCPKNVVWKDDTGCLSLIMSTDNYSKEGLLYRSLNTLYPTLQPFFVSQCHVQATLSFKEYYSVLRIIAGIFRPHTVLDKVLNVFAMWSDSIRSGQVSSTVLPEWRELLQKEDSKVFPTVQNKWVSLHSADGILCWCDNEALGKMFLASKGVHYLCVDKAVSNACFGSDAEIKNAEVLGPFLQAMSILPLSKVVRREAIPYGAQKSNQLMELFNWAVPYVQRYLQKLHPNVYGRLQKAPIDERLNRFSCLVCNQLFFRYKLPGELCTTSERLECNHLLEGDVFYAAQTDDLNSLFLEFSKLFFEGSSNVQLANFLHLITLSLQSGSNETEIEALLASQGINSFRERDAKWTFHFSDCEILPESPKKFTEPCIEDFAPKKAKKFFAGTWPSRSMQHEVGNFNHRSLHAQRLAACQKSLEAIMTEIEIKKGHKPQRGATEAGNSKTETAGAKSKYDCKDSFSGEGTSSVLIPRDDLCGQVSFPNRDQLAIGQPNEQRQELTGRLGEAVVFNHLLEKHGPELVRWMNAEVESGLPYDIVLEGDDGQKKLMEVKTTWTEDKDWFEMSPHEWELACRLGERFVIVRVFLTGGSSARFLWLPDPSQLCQQRLIKLALVLPRHNHGHGL